MLCVHVCMLCVQVCLCVQVYVCVCVCVYDCIAFSALLCGPIHWHHHTEWFSGLQHTAFPLPHNYIEGEIGLGPRKGFLLLIVDMTTIRTN